MAKRSGAYKFEKRRKELKKQKKRQKKIERRQGRIEDGEPDPAPAFALPGMPELDEEADDELDEDEEDQ